MRRFFLGIDGGGSGARARLAGGDGCPLGEGAAGPANAGNDPAGAFAALDAAARGALAAAGLADVDRADVVAVIGAAGAADAGAAAGIAAMPFGFAGLKVVTDAEIALEGAFAGGDGGILMTGNEIATAMREGIGPFSSMISLSVRPSTNSSTIYGSPSVSPTSNARTMFSCERWSTARASRSKRRKNSASLRYSSLSTLMATIFRELRLTAR